MHFIVAISLSKKKVPELKKQGINFLFSEISSTKLLVIDKLNFISSVVNSKGTILSSNILYPFFKYPLKIILYCSSSFSNIGL